jgi:hypothetical protein
MATASSGCTPLEGALPKNFVSRSWMMGMRVCPPTSITSSICLVLTPASTSTRATIWQRAVHQVLGELLQLLPGEGHLDVQGLALSGHA